LKSGKKLVLGGVDIEHSKGLVGHSDADVLVHAVIDAIIGGAALGDIGKFFPSSDKNYKNASSLRLLVKIVNEVELAGFQISNIDSTIVAQRPVLAEFIPQMCENLAEACCIERTRINVKAKTEERLGFTGKMLGISAHAVVLLSENHLF
jgi:2-C-methyl-D-erythritol 2,4-cyclodiphosphate synthase